MFMYFSMMVVSLFSCSFFTWLSFNFFFLFLFFYFLFYFYCPLTSLSYCKSIFFLDSLSVCLILLTLWIMSLILTSSQDILKYMNFEIVFLLSIFMLFNFLFLSFLVNDFFLFFFLFEAAMFPTLFLIMGWGYQPERLSASFYFFFYTFLSSIPLFLMIFWIYYISGSSYFFFYINLLNFNFFLYFFMTIMGFLVKLPLFIFHLWLPKAHVEAPVGGSMVLAAILLKLGAYGIFRFFFFKLWVLHYFFNFFFSLCLWGGLCCSFICLLQFDMKSLVAYSSVSHMGMVLCGVMSSKMLGMGGSFMMLLAHGLCSSGFFSILNYIYYFSFVRSIFFNKGFLVFFPSFSLFFFLMSFLNMSAPPSLNLLSEILIFFSIVEKSLFFSFFLFFLSWICVCYTMNFYSFLNHGNFSCLMNTFSSFMCIHFLNLIFHFIPCIFMSFYPLLWFFFF